MTIVNLCMTSHEFPATPASASTICDCSLSVLRSCLELFYFEASTILEMRELGLR